MPSKKQPTVPEWQVILEDIQSQNRATIEAVEASRLSLEQQIDRVERDSRSRDAVLEMASRRVSADLRDLTSVVQENTTDIRALKEGIQEQTIEIRGLKEGLQVNTVEIRGLKAGLQEHGAEIRGLKAGLQDNGVEIRGLKAGLQDHGAEIRTLSDKVGAMVRIGERVTALEQRRD